MTGDLAGRGGAPCFINPPSKKSGVMVSLNFLDFVKAFLTTFFCLTNTAVLPSAAPACTGYHKSINDRNQSGLRHKYGG